MEDTPGERAFGEGMLSQRAESKANHSHVSSMGLGTLRKPLLLCSQPSRADIIIDSLSVRRPEMMK